MNDIRVKICGVTSLEIAECCALAGAAYIGFVNFEKSPRHLSARLAADIAINLSPICKVALMVNPDDRTLDAYLSRVPIDMIQLHGTESVERVAFIKEQFGLPIMKAIGIAERGDLDKISAYHDVVDQFLIDAKPPSSSPLPGGNGLAFDWQILQNRRFSRTWMLAGGLNAENVQEAILKTGARQIDVSSGVETGAGRKDMKKITDFIEAARTAEGLIEAL